MDADIDTLKTVGSGDMKSWWIYCEDSDSNVIFAYPNGGIFCSLYCGATCTEGERYRDINAFNDYIDEVTWGSVGNSIASALKKCAEEIWDDRNEHQRADKIGEKLISFVDANLADENADWCAEIYDFE